jgi:deoxycytidylate deaminase
MANAAKRLPMAAPPAPKGKADRVSGAVAEEESHDLVFGLAAHAGAGPSHIAKKLADELRGKDFKVVTIVLSELIREVSTVAFQGAHERTYALQNAGTALRKKHGESIVAGLAIRAISEARAAAKGPTAFILDSLKHPKELELLRSVYKTSFYLVGVSCHEAKREKRLELKYKGASAGELEQIKWLDEEDPEDEGQQVRSLLHLADFFLSNDVDFGSTSDQADPVADALSRFVRMVTGNGVERPTKDECGMYAAWGASLRSACMSRQVGAAIVDEAGNVLSTGTNEVPKHGGGAYDEESERIEEGEQAKLPVPFGRCFHHGNCFNESKKAEIYAEAAGALRSLLDSTVPTNAVIRALEAAKIEEDKREDIARAIAELVAPATSVERVSKALKRTRIGALIEFSRAVHAEADAIVSVARLGGVSVKGATLYCRTYPCHSCARLIVSAGIASVIYVEPYRKSLATELHADSIVEISSSPEQEHGRVNFRLFVGVAPRRFAALFEERRDLKDPKATQQDAPRHQAFLHAVSHTELERKIAKQVDDELSRPESKEAG